MKAAPVKVPIQRNAGVSASCAAVGAVGPVIFVSPRSFVRLIPVAEIVVAVAPGPRPVTSPVSDVTPGVMPVTLIVTAPLDPVEVLMFVPAIR